MHRRWWGRLTLSFLATLPDSNMKLWSCPLGLSDRIFPFPKWWQALVRSREKESTILGSYVPTSQLGNVPLKLLWPLTHSRNFVLEFLRLAVSIIVWLAWTRELGLFTRIWGPLGLHLPPRNNYMLFHWAALWAAVSPRSLQSALTYAVDRTFNSISVEMSTNDPIYVSTNRAVSNGFTIDKEKTRDAYEIFKREVSSIDWFCYRPC